MEEPEDEEDVEELERPELLELLLRPRPERRGGDTRPPCETEPHKS